MCIILQLRYPTYNCHVNNEIVNLDHIWIHDTFNLRQKRGGEIIEYRGHHAASAASAIYDHINVLENGSNDTEAIGILSSGEYDISPGLMFSLPLNVSSSAYSVKEDIDIEPSIAKLIKASESELKKERDIVKRFLP